MSRKREVPQFIDIEDKIAFQLTAKQLGWIALGCFLAFLAWAFLEKTYFIIISVLVFIAILALIFVKPFGQTLPVFFKNLFVFIFKPKVYIWRKGYQKNPISQKEKTGEGDSFKKKKKKVDPEKLKKAIESLDIYE